MGLRIGDKKPLAGRDDGRFVIVGGRALKGSVPIFGAKNAATKMIAAALLTPEPCILENVPRIEDVHCMLDIAGTMGAEVEWIGPHTVRLRAQHLDPSRIPKEVVGRLRASIVVLGALLGRFRRVTMPLPGGDIIGARPLTTHFDAFSQFGILVRHGKQGVTAEWKKKPKGPLTVVLREFSVTATENALLLAASLPGPVTIQLAAAEPHVMDLARFLVKIGAKITGFKTHTLRVSGTRRFRDLRHRITPDSIDAVTFLAAGAATRGSITVHHAHAEELVLPLKKLWEWGAILSVNKKSITIRAGKRMFSALTIQTLPYPGFPTDAQAPFAVLLTQGEGESHIHETMYEDRFGYRKDLVRMGAEMAVLNPHELVIRGPSRLFGRDIRSMDIRAGAALVIAGLVAQGRTIVHGTYQIDRGYERIEERLQAVGADITRLA